MFETIESISGVEFSAQESFEMEYGHVTGKVKPLVTTEIEVISREDKNGVLCVDHLVVEDTQVKGGNVSKKSKHGIEKLNERRTADAERKAKDTSKIARANEKGKNVDRARANKAAVQEFWFDNNQEAGVPMITESKVDGLQINEILGVNRELAAEFGIEGNVTLAVDAAMYAKEEMSI